MRMNGSRRARGFTLIELLVVTAIIAILAALLKIDKEVGATNVAAIVIEPIQGEGGFIVPAEGFLSAIADKCNETIAGCQITGLSIWGNNNNCVWVVASVE